MVLGSVNGGGQRGDLRVGDLRASRPRAGQRLSCPCCLIGYQTFRPQIPGGTVQGQTRKDGSSHPEIKQAQREQEPREDNYPGDLQKP